MFVVLFEFVPKVEQWERYLQLASMLRPELLEIRGFVDNERYASERREGHALSLSTWADEKALVRWRTHARHHEVQRLGRFEVFENYRLRVGEVLSDSDRNDLPHSRVDATEVGAAPAVTVSEAALGEVLCFPESSADMLDVEAYGGITTTGKCLLLASWRSDEASRAWIERQPEGARHRHIRVIRDYGMHRRAEAPQYFGDLRDVPADRFGL